MKITNKEIIAYIESIDKELKENRKTKFAYNIAWANKKFDDRPALYALFDKNVLVYIGQSASLLKRMKDLRRTYNHSFRKKLGKKLFEIAPNKKGVFSESQENKLNEYLENNVAITFCYLNFGRLEAESYIIHKNKGENSDSLYNKIGKRDLSITKYL